MSIMSKHILPMASRKAKEVANILNNPICLTEQDLELQSNTEKVI
jgi:hypothetical protein